MASTFMNCVASTMTKRKSPLTTSEISERTGASEKTVRNYLTETSRVARWVPEGSSVVRLSRGGANQYCVRKNSELLSTIKAAGRTWYLEDSSSYKSSYSTA